MVGPRLRVVSYNVHALRDDRAALADVVRALAPDVLIVQEGPRRWRWRTRCTQLARAFGLVYAAGGQPAAGNVIMTNYRVRVHDAWPLAFPLTPGRQLRGAAFARCSVDRVPFAVAGSHLATDGTERPAQARLLREALDRIEGAYLLGADVNETAAGESWKLLADGLVDAATATGQGSRGTFPTPEARRRIDLIFTHPSVRVTSYQVVDGPVAHRASDHFPVVADLELPVP